MACGVRGDIPRVAWCPPLGHLAGERHTRLDSALEHRSQALRLDPHRWGRRSKSQPYCAINLGVATDRIDTVVDCRASKEKGVKSRGTTGAGGAALATLAATGDLHIPIAATYPLTAVRDAYQALADHKVHGRIVLHPQDLV
jgi:hypothetical protein